MSKGGRLSRLFPKLFRSDRDKNEAQGGDGKNPVCLILFLDDNEQRISYKTNWKGQVLFDLVCGQVNLVEKDYFGLRFVDNAGQTHWLDPSKSLSSQLKGCSVPHKFYFCVKFYAADPCKLREEITRYLFYLQVKRDILQGRLPVTFDEAGELCAYAVQSELGDFDPRVHTPGYVSELCFVPNQTEDLEARIAAMHRRCVGATPLMAEHRFLEKAKWLKMYGVDLHPVQGESSVEYFLGLTPTGIVVYKHKSEVANYFWPRVAKATFKAKIFIIKVKDKNNDEHSYAFELSSKAACKHLWKCCMEHHAFFRLIQAKDKESRPTKVLRSLSNSSHRGRSERKANSEQINRNQPDVRRTPSRRQPRRISSDSRLSGEQSHEQRRRSPDRMITMMGHPQPVRAPRHRSLPELQGRESPRSTKSAPWESRLDYGLYTSGHDSTSERAASQGRHPRTVSGSDSESGISHRKRYFPTRKGSDNESDGSTSRRRRREIDSDSGSEVSFTNSGQGKKLGNATRKDHNKNDVHILYPFHDKENHRNGSIPSLHSAPVGDVKQQRRRRRRSKSPGTNKGPPEELKQHIAFDLVETEGMTSEELKDIAYTKVETKGSLFRVKYSPKFRQKIWASRRKSFGEFDKQQERGKSLDRHDTRNSKPSGTHGGYTTHGSSMDEKPPPYSAVQSRQNYNYSSGPDYAMSGYETQGSFVSSHTHKRPPPPYHASSHPKTHHPDSDHEILALQAPSRDAKSDIISSRRSEMNGRPPLHDPSQLTSPLPRHIHSSQSNSGVWSLPQNDGNGKRIFRRTRDSEASSPDRRSVPPSSTTQSHSFHRLSAPPSSPSLQSHSYGRSSFHHSSTSPSYRSSNKMPNHLSSYLASNSSDLLGSHNTDTHRYRSNTTTRSSPARPTNAEEMQYDNYGPELRKYSQPQSQVQNQAANSYHNPVYFNNDAKASGPPHPTSQNSGSRYDRHTPDHHGRSGASPQSNYKRSAPTYSSQGVSSSSYQSNPRSVPQAQTTPRSHQSPTRNSYQDFQDSHFNRGGAEAGSLSPGRVSVGVTTDTSQMQPHTPPSYRPSPNVGSNYHGRTGQAPRYNSQGTNYDYDERASYKPKEQSTYDRYAPSSMYSGDTGSRMPPQSNQTWADNPVHMRGHSASSSGYSGSHSRQSGGTPSGLSPRQSQTNMRPYHPQYAEHQSSQSPYQPRPYGGNQMPGRKSEAMHHPEYSRAPSARAHRSDLVTEL